MNVIASGLASQTFLAGDFPLRDTFVLVLMFTGIALLVVAGYLLFAGVGPAAIPMDPARRDH